MAMPTRPSSTLSARNSDRIRPGWVPSAARVPISRMRSYTAITITFMMLISTIATSITLIDTVIRSIILAMLENGDSASQVCTSSAGLPSLALTSSRAVRMAAVARSSWSRLPSRTAISLTSGLSMRSSSRASSICR